jgi:DNA-binding transcriptional LysR family regulator
MFEKLFSDTQRTARESPVETSSVTLVRGLLLNSDRIALISTHQAQHELELGLLAPLASNLKETERPIGITLRGNWRPTGVQKALLDALRDAGAKAHHVTAIELYSKIE